MLRPDPPKKYTREKLASRQDAWLIRGEGRKKSSPFCSSASSGSFSDLAILFHYYVSMSNIQTSLRTCFPVKPPKTSIFLLPSLFMKKTAVCPDLGWRPVYSPRASIFSQLFSAKSCFSDSFISILYHKFKNLFIKLKTVYYFLKKFSY